MLLEKNRPIVINLIKINFTRNFSPVFKDILFGALFIMLMSLIIYYFFKFGLEFFISSYKSKIELRQENIIIQYEHIDSVYYFYKKWKCSFELIEIQTFIFICALGYFQSSQYGTNILLLNWK